MATRKLRLPKKLVIDRSKWGRGESGGYLLYDGVREAKRGKMCCLGFACLAMGASSGDIRNVPMPEDVMIFDGELPAWLKGDVCNDEVATDATRLATLNDDCSTTDQQKERAIKRIFAKHGCKVTFVNGEKNDEAV